MSNFDPAVVERFKHDPRLAPTVVCIYERDPYTNEILQVRQAKIAPRMPRGVLIEVNGVVYQGGSILVAFNRMSDAHISVGGGVGDWLALHLTLRSDEWGRWATLVRSFYETVTAAEKRGYWYGFGPMRHTTDLRAAQHRLMGEHRFPCHLKVLHTDIIVWANYTITLDRDYARLAGRTG